MPNLTRLITLTQDSLLYTVYMYTIKVAKRNCTFSVHTYHVSNNYTDNFMLQISMNRKSQIAFFFNIYTYN